MLKSKNVTTQTVKVQILPNDEQIETFKHSQDCFIDACNFVSQYIFNNNFELNLNTVQQAVYKDIRAQFDMPSQMSISVIHEVIAKYKTIRTEMSKSPFRFRQSKGQWVKVQKDLSWLHRPVHFKSPKVVLVRNRSYSKLQDDTMSISTLSGRLKVKAILDKTYLDKFRSDDWRFGEAELLERNGKWFLYISATKDIPKVDRPDIKQVVGIDRGLRQLMTTYDSDNQTQFFNGQDVKLKRAKYKKLRQQLQAKGTPSAKRLLNRLNQKENRWMNDVNHQLSKALIDHYGANTLFVLEDLSGVRNQTEKVRLKDRYVSVSWAYYDLEQKLSYKAAEVGSLVVKVDAHYTSQRCSRCGRIDSKSRNSKQHEFTCTGCGYRTNDDRNAAKNIQELGKQWMSGARRPKYTKVEPKIDYQ